MDISEHLDHIDLALTSLAKARQLLIWDEVDAARRAVRAGWEHVAALGNSLEPPAPAAPAAPTYTPEAAAQIAAAAATNLPPAQTVAPPVDPAPVTAPVAAVPTVPAPAPASIEPAPAPPALDPTNPPPLPAGAPVPGYVPPDPPPPPA